MRQDRTCQTCGVVFIGGPRAYYCPNCRVERRRKSDGECRRRQRLGITRVGKPDVCERCGATYLVNGGLQRFCPACQKEHAMEHKRGKSLAYYYANRGRINPRRMIQRRKGPAKCVVCGKEFKAPTCAVTCSSECRREWINLRWRTRYYNGYKRRKD